MYGETANAENVDRKIFAIETVVKRKQTSRVSSGRFLLNIVRLPMNHVIPSNFVGLRCGRSSILFSKKFKAFQESLFKNLRCTIVIANTQFQNFIGCFYYQLYSFCPIAINKVIFFVISMNSIGNF